MLEPALWILLSLVVLSLGAEALVRGASAVARRLGLSPFVIGLTIVGFGTSSPEMFASISAGLQGAGDIAVGNVVGSNIFNIAIILGLVAVVQPIPVPMALLRGEALPLLVTASLPWLACFFPGSLLPRWLGVLMVLGLVAYVVRAYRAGRQQAKEPAIEARAEADLKGATPEAVAHPLKSAAYILVGLALLVWGADMLVDNAVRIAKLWGVSDLAIGLTIVAGGTSMPELVTSLVAALRGRSEIAVGNVVGSNVFNIAGVLGATASITPQRVAPQVLQLDTPVMLLATVLLLSLSAWRGRITRLEGALLAAGWIGYTVVLMS
ncbi:MAG: calcium/sodium antiporter [Planctomycetia bacterium]